LGKVRELQALNCIASQKSKRGSCPEPDEYNPHPNPFKCYPPISATKSYVSHLSHACYMFHPPLFFLLSHYIRTIPRRRGKEKKEKKREQPNI
jgi:hypothetical protein